MAEISRRQYAELYGPTVEDRFRLADTTLICQIERDLLTYGDELVFGGGKTPGTVWGKHLGSLTATVPLTWSLPTL